MDDRRREDTENERARGPLPGSSQPDPRASVANDAHASHATVEDELVQLVAGRRRELEEQADRLEDAVRDLERREGLLRDQRSSVERMLRLGTGELAEREAELQDFRAELAEREARLSAAEADLSRRRTELGAVELKREAVEQRERALSAREVELELAATRVREGSAGGPDEAGRAPASGRPVSLLFVPGESYRLTAVEPRDLEPGAALELEGAWYVVARIGASPLPGDTRRCAYLERGRSASSEPVGSS